MKAVFLLLLGTLVTFATPAPSSDDGFPLLVAGGGIGGIFKGPNKETIIQGPDGSVITSENEPGIIVQSNELKEPSKPIIVAEAPEEPTVNVVQDTRPTATVENIIQPIESIVQDVRPIATAFVAPPVKIETWAADNSLVANLKDEVLLGYEPRKIIYKDYYPESPQQSLIPPKISLSTVSPSLAPQRYTLSSTPTYSPVLSSTTAPPVLSSSLAPAVSTLGPQVLSSTLAPEQLQDISSTAASNNLIESDRIDLGIGNLYRLAIPVVEYASSNGFVNNARAEILGVNSQPVTSRQVTNFNFVSTPSPLETVNTQGNLDDNEIQPQSFYALGQSNQFPLQLSSGPNYDLPTRNFYQAGPQSDLRRISPRKEFLTLEDRIESDLWSRYSRDTKKSKK